MKTDLSDLIENPREDLGVECKAWLDLSIKINKANIARHLAALANHGGGYMLFGFNDDLTRDLNRPSDAKSYSRDVFAEIIRKYLTPTFQCEVIYVSAENGDFFPVVRVPGHESVPIASKVDGPKNKSGKIQGIKSDTYYIRKPGPESAPIVGVDEWAPLIRRCVLNDRDSLLKDLSTLIQSPHQLKKDRQEELTKWHKNSEQRFLKLIPDYMNSRWSVSLRENRYQLSYLISTEEGELLPTSKVPEILETVNVGVRDIVWTGWSMFYPFKGTEFEPYISTENLDGTGNEVLECNLMINEDYDITLPDFWRIVPDGRVTLIRGYREDRDSNSGYPKGDSGTWLSPETVVRETAELVTHARLLAQHFQTPIRIAFQCTWLGLKGRKLDDFDPMILWRDSHVAKTDRRITGGEWEITAIAANWHSIVAELSSQILHLFRFTGCNAEYVEKLAPKFVKI